MTIKQFKLAKIIIAVIMAAVISQSIALNILWLPLVTIAIGIIGTLALRRKVKSIISDERDFKIGGNSARYTISILTIAGSILTFVLIFLKDQNPNYEIIGTTIAFCVCLVLVTYSIIFTYLNRKSSR